MTTKVLILHTNWHGVVPGDARVDLEAVKTLMNGTYVSFASRDIAERLAGSVAGTVRRRTHSARPRPSYCSKPPSAFNRPVAGYTPSRAWTKGRARRGGARS